MAHHLLTAKLLSQGKFFFTRMDRDNPENLISANDAFMRARDILMRSRYPDPTAMLKTLHGIVQARMEMSYNRGCSPQEKLAHLQTAKGYSDNALEYFRLADADTGDLALVELYRKILVGREVEVLAKPGGPNLDVRKRKDEAAREIELALGELRKFAYPNCEKHRAWADMWYVILMKP